MGQPNRRRSGGASPATILRRNPRSSTVPASVSLPRTCRRIQPSACWSRIGISFLSRGVNENGVTGAEIGDAQVPRVGSDEHRRWEGKRTGIG
jgi:hypothetical protein